jgi:hypothetical protein
LGEPSLKKQSNRLFILGAGASKACGIPLASELLKEVFEKSEFAGKDRLMDLLRYLYPRFEPQWGNYPNIEEFLSLVDVTITFNEKVKSHHKFTTNEISELRDQLLTGIATLLLRVDPSVAVKATPLLSLAKHLRPNDTVVTFNWDLLLEGALFSLGIDNWSYVGNKSKVTILKPHGSLDWYDSGKVKFKEGRSYPLLKGGVIHVYQYFESPHLKHTNTKLPVIIPPTIAKEWPYDEFDKIWHRTWHSLRYADEIYVIGFSLPPEDLHVRFVMRSAIRSNENNRSTPLILKLVNPDPAAHIRFIHLANTPITYFQCGFERISMEELTGQNNVDG